MCLLCDLDPTPRAGNTLCSPRQGMQEQLLTALTRPRAPNFITASSNYGGPTRFLRHNLRLRRCSMRGIRGNPYRYLGRLDRKLVPVIPCRK